MIWVLRYTSTKGHHLYIDDNGHATDQRKFARTFETQGRANEFATVRHIDYGYQPHKLTDTSIN
jgi:hypothetical protein